MLRHPLFLLALPALAAISIGCAAAPAAAPPPGRPALRVVVPEAPDTTSPASPGSPQPGETRSPGERESAEEPMLVFLATPSCGSLERTAVPAAQPEDAVRMILRSESLSRLPVTEPSVKVTAGVAHIDLTLPHGSKRSLRALSRCEKIALLGAISNTLKGNPRWGIRHVLFTERGDLLAVES